MHRPLENKSVYGGIINLATNEEFDFCNISVPEVLPMLLSLPGTVYGVDWVYAGDLDATMPDANIYVVDIVDDDIFDGTTAVADFIAMYVPLVNAEK